MKKRVLLGVLVVLLALSLAACGPGVAETPAPVEEETPAEEAPAEEAAPVSLRLWTHQNPAFNAGYEALIEAYQSANPNVTITLETFDKTIETLGDIRLILHCCSATGND